MLALLITLDIIIVSIYRVGIYPTPYIFVSNITIFNHQPTNI